MGKQVFANNASSQLVASITATDTTLTVQPGDGAKFPDIVGNNYFYVTLQNALGNIEIVKVIAKAGDTFTVERAAEDAAQFPPQAWAAGDTVELRLTAGGLDNYQRHRWDVLSNNAVVSAGDKIMVNSANSAITLTLPVVPQLGDQVDIMDVGGNTLTNPISIDLQGQNFNGLPTPPLPKIRGANKYDRTALVYVGGTDGWVESGPGLVYAYDTDTEAHIARMVDTTDTTLLRHLDILIRGLKSAGLWTKLIQICVAHTAASDSLLNLKGSKDAVLVNTPTFTPNLGFTTNVVDGSQANDGYIDSTINLATEPGVTINNWHMSVYNRTQITSGAAFLLSVNASLALDNLGVEIISETTGIATHLFADGFPIGPVLITSTSTGFIGGTRLNGTAELNKNGRTATATFTSTRALVSASILIGHAPVFSTGLSTATQLTGWTIGTGLTSAELDTLRNLITTYMSNRGAAV